MFVQRRNETIISAGEIHRGEKALVLQAGPASSSSSSCLQGTGRVEVKDTALCHCSCSGSLGRTGRRWSGTGRRVCRYDGLRSEAGGPPAAGGSAADCGRHHHRAALHHCSQFGKEKQRFGQTNRRRAEAFTHRHAVRTARWARSFLLLNAAIRKLEFQLTWNTDCAVYKL